MILIPNFTKKHAAALVLGVAAVTTSIAAFQNKNEANVPFPSQESFVADAVAPGVTVDEYASKASAACKGFLTGDISAVSAVLDRLASLTVPQQAMSAHFDLVSMLTTYRQALVAGDQAAAARILDRLKIFVKENNWIGIAI